MKDDSLTYLNGCELCNIGVVNEVTRLMEEEKMSIRQATSKMEEDITKASGGVKLFTADSIRGRFKRVKGSKGGSQRPSSKKSSKTKVKEGGTQRPTFPEVDYKREIMCIAEAFDELQDMYDNLYEQLMVLMDAEATDKLVEPVKDTFISRERILDFIIKHGNNFQVSHVTGSNPDNERLFNLFSTVRTTYLESNPPMSLPEDILNAESIS